MPPRASRLSLWVHDAAMAKQALREIERLTANTPSLASYVGPARATYLVLRGKHAEALQHLEHTDEKPQQSGWSFHRALLARIYNALKRHQEAKDVCARALAQLRPEELNFVVVHLNLQVEVALADAGLGAFEVAEQQLAGLLERYADRGPLVLGWIHRARARVALLRGELENANQGLAQMESEYRTTGFPTLLTLSAELRDELRRLRDPKADDQAPLTAEDAHLLTRIGLIMTSEEHSLEHQATTALRLAKDITNAEHGFIVYSTTEGAVSFLGQPPVGSAIEWAQDQLLEALAQEERTALLTDVTVTADGVLRTAGLHHSLCLLWCQDGAVERPVAALVLAAEGGPPALPPSAALRLLGERLARRPANDQTSEVAREAE